MSFLYFRCPTTGAEFNSGFKATSAEIEKLDKDARLTINCSKCGKKHEFAFVEGRVVEP